MLRCVWMDDGLSLVSLNEVSRMAHHTTRPSESGDVVVRFGLWGGDGRGRMKRSRGDICAGQAPAYVSKHLFQITGSYVSKHLTQNASLISVTYEPSQIMATSLPSSPTGPPRRPTTSFSTLPQLSKPFLLDPEARSYRHQYSNIYFVRLVELRPIVEDRAQERWGGVRGQLSLNSSPGHSRHW